MAHDYEALQRMFAAPTEYPGLQRLHTTALRVWQFPSLETWAGWSVHRVEDQVWVRRITWGPDRQQPDIRRTWAADARIDPGILERLDQELQSIRLPASIDWDAWGLDGTTRGVAAGSSPARVMIEWWEHGPEALRELDRWHARAIAILDEPLPQWSALPWL